MTTPVDQLTANGWTADDSTFGARLALIRQRMAWGNVKEAATECRLPAESWRTWERDGVIPRRLVEIAASISERTGCDHTWLVMGSSRPSGRPGDRATQTIVPDDSSIRPMAERTTSRPVAARVNRHVATTGGPYGGGRRDATRPVSAVPFSKRRPARIGSGNRPITD